MVGTQLSDDVPLILADRVQLQQVILNLMMNAIEAMTGPGAGPRELLVRSGTDDSRGVLVSVEDSGPGLDPKSLDHIFDAFYTTKPHGLGMGLAISRSLIEVHGGDCGRQQMRHTAPCFSSRCRLAMRGWHDRGAEWYSSSSMFFQCGDA